MIFPKMLLSLMLRMFTMSFAQNTQSFAGGASSQPPASQLAAATPFAVDINGGAIVITNAGATTCNIPAPVAGQDDFKSIDVYTSTAFAHILAFGANKLNGNKTSLTWTAARAGFICTLRAFNGVWYALTYADAAAFAQAMTLA